MVPTLGEIWKKEPLLVMTRPSGHSRVDGGGDGIKELRGFGIKVIFPMSIEVTKIDDRTNDRREKNQ